MSVHQTIYPRLEGLVKYEFLSRHTKYQVEEIRAAIKRAEVLEEQYQALCVRAAKVLSGMSFVKGYASDAHEKLAFMDGHFQIATKGGTNESFPVKTWKTILDKQERFNARFEKAIKALEQDDQS